MLSLSQILSIADSPLLQKVSNLLSPSIPALKPLLAHTVSYLSSLIISPFITLLDSQSKIMEGGAAAIEVLVQNLINVCKEEISRIRGLEKDAGQLKTTLEMIRSYLNDAEKKFITQEAVKTWLKEIEEVAFNAENVLDELNYHALHNEVKAMKPKMNNALSCFSSFDHMIVRPHQMALTIKEINSSFDSINKRATDLHLQSMFVDAPPAVPDAALETNSFTLDPVFIGRDDAVPQLVELMTESPEERMSILAVVGMGGLGKTTLTRKVFNHQKMKTQFGCHSWVHVSQTFNPLIIFKEFLASLPSQTDEDKSRERATGENDNEPTGSRQASSLKLQKSFKAKTDEVESMEGILKKLHKALKAKTYLLVLDDVWNRDLQKWNHFIDSLSGVTSTKGNGIIITTRSTEVASIVNPLETYRLNALSDEDCWSIIKAKAFEMGNVIPSEFESIGRRIARRCQGLPLAAKVVGGVLRRKSEQDWLSIEHNWLSDVDGDYIKRILRLSYDNLSSPSLKKCFAYCSIFPKGHKMVKQELIELWMAEGFLQSNERNDMESVGDNFINVLLHNALLQVVPRNNDEDEEICVMHDLVHDLASSVLGSFKVRYMRHGDESSPIPKESAKYLRTLFIQGKVSSEFKLSDFKCLHVLSFDGRSGQYERLLSSSIGKLMNLRELNISKTEIEYLPDSIGELHHLQTLRADTYYLRKLPKTLKNLIRLRHLLICNGVKLPPKIVRLTSLQTLPYFIVDRENGCRIEELGSLKNLKGKLKIFNLEKVQGKEEAEKANIFQNPSLLELKFDWYYRREEGERNDENVLEGLQPHPNLKKLEIHGFIGKRFPSWTLNMAVRDGPQGSWVGLKKLVEITLSYCTECEEIPPLGHLPNLKHLHLKGFYNVKSINSSFYGINNYIGVGQETIIVFPVLERLELDDMPNLIEWAEVQFPNETETLSHEVKVFPRLKYLKINGCKKLENFGKLLANICGVTLMSLTALHIGGVDGLECLPDWLFRNNQNLSKLEISECPKLRELPDGLHTLKSLEELKIEDCPKLKSIGNASGSGGQSQGILRRLWIRKCDALMDLPHDMVESWALSLEVVSLCRLSSLTNLPNVIEYLAKSARLTELSIVGVPKFMAARSVERWPFRSLQKLKIDASVEWSRESSFAIKETVDGILRGCSHSLLKLSLTGLEIWECLPESIQNLAGVWRLKLCNFGIEELPEWFGSLSSVRKLSLSRFKKLRHQGGRNALRRLTQLRYLKIDDCSGLSVDSRWPRDNFPHARIAVDGHQIFNCTQ